MNPLHLVNSAVLLFVLGVVIGLSWSTSSNARQQVLSQPAQPSLQVQRIDQEQNPRAPRWVF